MPRGVNPLVSRFLAYHKHLLPIRGFKTIRDSDIAAVGVVDTQSVDRLGAAGRWLQLAEHVVVVDHHMAAPGDINPDEAIIEPVPPLKLQPLTLQPLKLPPLSDRPLRHHACRWVRPPRSWSSACAP